MLWCDFAMKVMHFASLLINSLHIKYNFGALASYFMFIWLSYRLWNPNSERLSWISQITTNLISPCFFLFTHLITVLAFFMHANISHSFLPCKCNDVHILITDFRNLPFSFFLPYFNLARWHISRTIDQITVMDHNYDDINDLLICVLLFL